MPILKINDDAHWHELRAKHIGGSDVAVLFGMSAFKSKWQLWMEKAGRLDAEDLSGNSAVQAGKFLEAGIAAWAASKWGMTLAKVEEYYIADDCAGLGATLDFATQDGVPVEIKWSARGHGWLYAGDTITHAPDSYILQVQHQMACYGGDYAWLVALIDNEPRRMKIKRSESIIASIKTEVTEFWQSIADNVEPDPDFNLDGDAISRLLEQAPITDVTLPEEAVALFAEHNAAKAEAKAADARVEAAKAELLLMAQRAMQGMNGDQTKAIVRAGDHKLTISTVAPNFGTVVTQEMVGTSIGTRKGYQTVRIV